MKSPDATPLIEIFGSETPIAGCEGIVKFKGKLLHPEVVLICDPDYVQVEMPAEVLLDFKAGELPEDMDLSVLMSDGECLGLLGDVSLSKKARYAEMRFSLDVDFENPFMGDFNPFVILDALIKAVEKENYKIDDEFYPGIMQVSVAVPFGDNVYSHYKKHLAVLETMCRVIEKDLMARLNEKYKDKH